MNVKKTLGVVFVLALLGLALALLATKQTVDVWMNPHGSPFMCSFVDWVDCRAVHLSRFALVAGVPVAWFGFLFYSWLSMITGWIVFGRKPNPVATKAVFQVSFLALLFNCYLLFAMAFKLQRLCPICLVLFGFNLSIFWFAASAQRNDLVSLPRRGLSAALTVHYVAIVLLLAAGYWVIRSVALFLS